MANTTGGINQPGRDIIKQAKSNPSGVQVTLHGRFNEIKSVFGDGNRTVTAKEFEDFYNGKVDGVGFWTDDMISDQELDAYYAKQRGMNASQRQEAVKSHRLLMAIAVNGHADETVDGVTTRYFRDGSTAVDTPAVLNPEDGSEPQPRTITFSDANGNPTRTITINSNNQVKVEEDNKSTTYSNPQAVINLTLDNWQDTIRNFAASQSHTNLPGAGHTDGIDNDEIVTTTTVNNGRTTTRTSLGNSEERSNWESTVEETGDTTITTTPIDITPVGGVQGRTQYDVQRTETGNPPALTKTCVIDTGDGDSSNIVYTEEENGIQATLTPENFGAIKSVAGDKLDGFRFTEATVIRNGETQQGSAVDVPDLPAQARDFRGVGGGSALFVLTGGMVEVGSSTVDDITTVGVVCKNNRGATTDSLVTKKDKDGNLISSDFQAYNTSTTGEAQGNHLVKEVAVRVNDGVTTTDVIDYNTDGVKTTQTVDGNNNRKVVQFEANGGPGVAKYTETQFAPNSQTPTRIQHYERDGMHADLVGDGNPETPDVLRNVDTNGGPTRDTVIKSMTPDQVIPGENGEPPTVRPGQPTLATTTVPTESGDREATTYDAASKQRVTVVYDDEGKVLSRKVEQFNQSIEFSLDRSTGKITLVGENTDGFEAPTVTTAERQDNGSYNLTRTTSDGYTVADNRAGFDPSDFNSGRVTTRTITPPAAEEDAASQMTMTFRDGKVSEVEQGGITYTFINGISPDKLGANPSAIFTADQTHWHFTTRTEGGTTTQRTYLANGNYKETTPGEPPTEKWYNKNHEPLQP